MFPDPLRPLSIIDLEATEKASQPVSIFIDNGRELVISRYEDNVWDFWPYIPNENKGNSSKKIAWSIDLGNGTRLTDSINLDLLHSCKDFIWSYFANPLEGRKRPGWVTVIHMTNGPLRTFLRWMVMMGFTSFSQVDGHSTKYIPYAKVGVSERGAAERLTLLELLYTQKGKIADTLQHHPWPYETAGNLSGVTNSPNRYKAKTSVIPDATLQKMGAIAIDFITRRASEILDTRDQLAHCSQKPIYDPTTKTAQRHVTLTAQQFGYGSARMHSRDLVNLRTACYIVIAMFSGIRDSELLSLSTDCVKRTQSKDGIELIWLCGTIYKTGIRAKRWGIPPIVETATKVMERLSAPARALLSIEYSTLASLQTPTADQIKRLQTISNQKSKLFLGMGIGGGGTEIVVTSNGGSQHHLRQFCRRHGIQDKSGDVWPLTPHQFRRTFAYNYARNQMGDLLTLREHYGHASLDMTLLYAEDGVSDYESDSDLLSMTTSAKRERHVEIISDLINGDRRISTGSTWVGEWRRTIRTARNKEQLIEELADTLSLSGTGHSWCAGSAKGTGCGSRCLFEPDMCTECKWAIISDEHLPVWKAIANQQEEIIACADIGKLGKERARFILEKAKKTIEKLEGTGENVEKE